MPGAEQASLPVEAGPTVAPRLPEPRPGEPATDYLWRALATAQEYWEAWDADRRRRGIVVPSPPPRGERWATATMDGEGT